MSIDNRPRRSMLYMPGSNARALDKGRNLKVDTIIMDLEDAVAPEAKIEARQEILNHLKEGGYGDREIIVRVNAIDTPWGEDDLRIMAHSGAHAIMLPKVNTAKRVQKSVDILERAGAPDNLKIWCMMETPKGILNAKDIAKSHKRMAGLLLGLEDLAKDLRVKPDADRSQLQFSMQRCILAARAYGLAVIDGVYTDVHNLDGLRQSCEQALAMGFDGKSLIHPKNLDIANEVFAPSAEEISHAKDVIEAFDAAKAEKKAVALLNGKLIEGLHAKEAQRILDLYQAIQNSDS
ncbi:HpcH/HpaI aldolase/citrate lyase family protein [Curvivirga sp.]|uniref:HpcH/HpaI aldolase/citrate lyase family protein n=1 Tax=Curvivirga sp. TaxID=2856848 RepID=UPI003B5B8CF1